MSPGIAGTILEGSLQSQSRERQFLPVGRERQRMPVEDWQPQSCAEAGVNLAWGDGAGIWRGRCNKKRIFLEVGRSLVRKRFCFRALSPSGRAGKNFNNLRRTVL